MYNKGQKLACIGTGEWVDTNTHNQEVGPKHDEIVTYLEEDLGYLVFEEYENAYEADRFCPLLGKSAVKELAVFSNTIETSDCPIIQPQTIEQ